ncbi:hypothetical protein HDU67_008503 [Dinochytrium kinnereticum]|nr:hypothetical protein HDU67_008503 [Dinochytrium kinnereticum]
MALHEPSVEMKLSDLDGVEEKARRQRSFIAMVHRLVGSKVRSIHMSDVTPLFQRIAEDPACHDLGGLSLGETTLAQLKNFESQMLTTGPDECMALDELWELFQKCPRRRVEGHSAGVSSTASRLPNPSPRSMLPRPIPSSPFAIEKSAPSTCNETENKTPPRPNSSRPKSPPSFGRKRTTPILGDSATARRAFETSRARSSSSTEDRPDGGMVGFDEREESIQNEEMPELEDCSVSPLDDSQDGVFPLSKEEMDAYGSTSIYYPASSNGTSDLQVGEHDGGNSFSTRSLGKRLAALNSYTNNSTPRRDEPEAFHTPMTSIKRTFTAGSLASRASPSPSLGGYGSRESPQITHLQDSWSPRDSYGHNRGRGNAVRLSPRSYRDIQGVVKKSGLPNETFMKICRAGLDESLDGDDTSSDELSPSELARITVVAIDLAKRLKEKDEELKMSQRESEHQLITLQQRIDELKKEVKEKKRTLATKKLVENEHVMQIETLEAEMERLHSELAETKRLNESLKSEVEERTEINLQLTTDLKWKEEEVYKRRLDTESMQKDLSKAAEDKKRLEDSLRHLTEQVAITEHAFVQLREDNICLNQELKFLKASNADDAQSETTDMATLAGHSPVHSGRSRSRENIPKPLSVELDSAYGSHTESATEEHKDHKAGGSRRADSKSRASIPLPPSKPIKECIHTQTEAPVPISSTSTQTTQVCLVNRSASPTRFSTIDFTAQTDPSLSRWRPMPVLSDADRSTDVVFPQTPMIDSASQCCVRTLEVGVQCGGEVAQRERERNADCQTEETIASLVEKDRVADMLRERCEALQRVVEELEGQFQQFDTLKEDLDDLENINSKLREELQTAQRISQENRRRVSLRKHFDDEVERWIAGMRQQLNAVNESVATAKDALEINAGRQALALEKIEQLEIELEQYKEMTSNLMAEKDSCTVEDDQTSLRSLSSPSYKCPPSSTANNVVAGKSASDHSLLSVMAPRIVNNFSVPRWAVPLLVYTVIVWNAGANLGTMNMQSSLEAFSFTLYSAGIIPSPTFFGLGTETGSSWGGDYIGTPGIDNQCTPKSFLGGFFEGQGGGLPPPM